MTSETASHTAGLKRFRADVSFTAVSGYSAKIGVNGTDSADAALLDLFEELGGIAMSAGLSERLQSSLSRLAAALHPEPLGEGGGL